MYLLDDNNFGSNAGNNDQPVDARERIKQLAKYRANRSLGNRQEVVNTEYDLEEDEEMDDSGRISRENNGYQNSQSQNRSSSEQTGFTDREIPNRDNRSINTGADSARSIASSPAGNLGSAQAGSERKQEPPRKSLSDRLGNLSSSKKPGASDPLSSLKNSAKGMGSGVGGGKPGMGSAGGKSIPGAGGGKFGGLANKIKSGLNNPDGKADTRNGKNPNGQEGDEKRKPGLGELLNDVKSLAGQDGSSRDPRDAVVGIADKYLHLGKKLVFLTWLVWYILALLSGILSIAIVGLPILLIVMVVLNIFIFSPKTVYRITELILDLVGVGEYLQAMDEIGLDKVEMKATGWQKASIVILDMIIVIGIILLVVGLTKAVCEYLGFNQGGVLAGLYSGAVGIAVDLYTGSELGSSMKQICEALGNGAK